MTTVCQGVTCFLLSSSLQTFFHFKGFFHLHVDMCLSSSPQNTGNGFQLA